MAVKYCICAICNQKFDRNAIQAVKYGGRRYAHLECHPNGELVPMELPPDKDPDLIKLNEYINNVYGEKANWPLIKKQIKHFREDLNYSYTGMLKSLVYFFEVKGNSIEKSNGGVGIIEYVFKSAYDYYYNLFMIQNQNTDATFSVQEKEIKIKIPKNAGTRKKLFKLGADNDEE